tara:strand:- start:161 stop:421 length:261 start_codon:yes stop_codon:yes gene_type:complete
MTTVLGLLLCSALVFSGCIAESDVDDDDDKECEDWAYWNNNGSTEGCPYADDDDGRFLGSPVWFQVTSAVGMLGIAAIALSRRATD